jgi:hypothetical protein
MAAPWRNDRQTSRIGSIAGRTGNRNHRNELPRPRSRCPLRSASLVLEEEKLEIKHQQPGKEMQMNAKLIVGSALETARAIAAGIAAGSLPPFP